LHPSPDAGNTPGGVLVFHPGFVPLHRVIGVGDGWSVLILKLVNQAVLVGISGTAGMGSDLPVQAADPAGFVCVFHQINVRSYEGFNKRQ